MFSGEHAERRESGCLRSIISFLAIVAAVLVLSWGIRTFVFQAYGIPSGSMENTIEVGDSVIVVAAHSGLRSLNDIFTTRR